MAVDIGLFPRVLGDLPAQLQSVLSAQCLGGRRMSQSCWGHGDDRPEDTGVAVPAHEILFLFLVLMRDLMPRSTPMC